MRARVELQGEVRLGGFWPTADILVTNSERIRTVVTFQKINGKIWKVDPGVRRKAVPWDLFWAARRLAGEKIAEAEVEAREQETARAAAGFIFRSAGVQKKPVGTAMRSYFAGHALSERERVAIRRAMNAYSVEARNEKDAAKARRKEKLEARARKEAERGRQPTFSF